MARVKVVVFDANETLLDLAGLDPAFRRVFGDARGGAVRARWFRQLVELFLTATVIDAYRPFPELADAALDMAAQLDGTAAGGREIADAERAAVRAAMLALPPHPDAPPALARLREAGVRLAVLTNSTATSAAAQMPHAGLDRYFERIVSADDVRRYKPAREAYAHAARTLDVGLDELRLVAAHGWDVAGALAAGCRAAFVARAGKALDPGGPAPEVVAPDLMRVAEQILARDG